MSTLEKSLKIGLPILIVFFSIIWASQKYWSDNTDELPNNGNTELTNSGFNEKDDTTSIPQAKIENPKVNNSSSREISNAKEEIVKTQQEIC